MGVPVKHQRYFPCSSQHATAPFVFTFLMLCASSNQQSSYASVSMQKMHKPRTMRNHLTPYNAHFFEPAFDLFLTVLESESESSSELLVFFFEEDPLPSFLAAGLNELYSDFTVSYVVTTTCCLFSTAGSAQGSVQSKLRIRQLIRL